MTQGETTHGRNDSLAKRLTGETSRYPPGHIHCVLKLPTNPVKEITRLSVKLKLLTDTYILQAKRAKFGPTYATSALCPLCKEDDETTEHFLLKCSSLKLVREVVFNELATQFVEMN